MELTEYEQSVLWRCLNDKPYDDSEFQDNLSCIIKPRLKEFEYPLYRGLSELNLNVLYEAVPGDVIQFDGVTSFTEFPCTAEMFSGRWHYETYCVAEIINKPSTFKYYELMRKILAMAPDCEFYGDALIGKPDKDRDELLDMLSDENEHMFPSGQKFIIKGWTEKPRFLGTCESWDEAPDSYRYYELEVYNG
ncbi:RNA polymerase ADP-ribosylase [Serratia phage 92A1]|nr:RNA polymerase ADP-ribosylase [Serratia phage 92A1]